MHIPISPKTRAALRVLIAKGVESLISTGSTEPVRTARRKARALEVRSADGRSYSGVLVVHRNEVTTGLVVEDEPAASEAPLALASEATTELPPDFAAALSAARAS